MEVFLGRRKIGEGVVRYRPPNELVLSFGGSYVRAYFGKNRSRNANVRVPTDGQTDATRFCNLSHAICYI